MNTVSIADAKNRLSELVKRAEAGEQITLTRRGRPVARLEVTQLSKTPSQAAQVAGVFAALTRLRAGTSLDGNLKAIARQGLD